MSGDLIEAMEERIRGFEQRLDVMEGQLKRAQSWKIETHHRLVKWEKRMKEMSQCNGLRQHYQMFFALAKSQDANANERLHDVKKERRHAEKDVERARKTLESYKNQVLCRQNDRVQRLSDTKKNNKKRKNKRAV